jgi:creatinine amidohydrolase/Fe(II)-dependent formamide hydrolase-like protein
MRVDPKEQLKTTEAIANERTRGPRSSAFRWRPKDMASCGVFQKADHPTPRQRGSSLILDTVEKLVRRRRRSMPGEDCGRKEATAEFGLDVDIH